MAHIDWTDLEFGCIYQLHAMVLLEAHDGDLKDINEGELVVGVMGVFESGYWVSDVRTCTTCLL